MPGTSLSCSLEDQALAACALCKHLSNFRVPYAFIGGFVLSVLGSDRRTIGIEVLLDYSANDLLDLRQQLYKVDRRFIQMDSKFYFIKDPTSDMSTGETVVRTGTGVVPIEIHVTGRFGLPTCVEPIYYIQVGSLQKFTIPILHPSVLILTKLTQWFVSQSSTQERWSASNMRNCDDVSFLIYWLASQEWKISPGRYLGTSREDILRYLRYYKEALAEDTVLMETLRGIMNAKDWTAMIN